VTVAHATDAQYPGAGAMYIDLGAYYDAKALRPFLEDIESLFGHYREYYKRAYGLIAAADCLSLSTFPGLIGEAERHAVNKKVSGAISRELGPARGRIAAVKPLQPRFISALTCQGFVCLDSTVSALCPRVYALDNEFGLADPYIRAVADAAAKRGIPGILCPDPIDPSRFEALLLPEMDLGFAAVSGHGGYGGECARHIRLDAIPVREKLRLMRTEIRACSKLRAQLLGESVAALSKAKALHDELEDIYNPFVDFDSVYALAQLHIDSLLG